MKEAIPCEELNLPSKAPESSLFYQVFKLIYQYAMKKEFFA